jgi:hypothetical protein
MNDRFESWLQGGLRDLDAAVPVGEPLAAPRARSTLMRVTRPATRSILPMGSLAVGIVIIVALAVLVSRPPAAIPGAARPSGLEAPVSSSASELVPASDGIPALVAGEPVLSGPAIGTRIAAATSDAAFLIGGYVVFVQFDCSVPSNLPSSPLTAPCGDGWRLGDRPGLFVRSPSTTSGPPPTSYRLVLGSSVPGWIDPIGAPIVLRVHVHDPRAAACASSIRDTCEQAIVVESVVWPIFSQAQARAAVLDTVTRFEQAIYVAHDPMVAWALLAPYSQRTISEADWTSAMRLLATQSGPGYEIQPPTLDWTVLNYAYVGQEEADIRTSADATDAYAVWVRHPSNPAISGGSEGMIVAPLRDGSGWRIWLVH